MKKMPEEEKLAYFATHLLNWFDRDGRSFPWRDLERPSYQIVVAEILLQRTKAETVSRYFDSFISKFPTWGSLANADVDLVGEALKPFGLWQRRSVTLKQLAQELVRREGEFPTSREELETLPGVGQYIASALMLFLHDTPEPLLDVNMARVLERYFGPRKLADIRYDPYLQRLSREILSKGDPVKINWAILDLAALFCKARSPDCSNCPLSHGCKQNI